MSLEAHLRPAVLTLIPGTFFYVPTNLSEAAPPFSVSYGRRLFPDSQGVASVSVSTTDSLPALSIAFSTGESAWDEDDDEHGFEPGTEAHSPSLHGFSSWRTQWAAGLQLQGALPSLFASSGILFAELGLRLYGNLGLGFMPNLTFGAAWSTVEDSVSEPLSLAAQVAISLAEISLKLK